MGFRWFACARLVCASFGILASSADASLDKAAAEGLSAAVTVSLIGTPNASAMRAEFHRVAFLRQASTRVALVIAKPSSQDCAANTVGRPGQVPCNVLVLEHAGGHRWKSLGHLPFGVYPIAARSADGGRLELFTTTSTDVAARHQRVFLTADGLVVDPSASLSNADVDAQAYWKIDDRNTPLLETVVRVFASGSPASLAPARILSDSTNANQSLQNSEAFELIEKSLLADLKEDLARVAMASDWPQLLDVRVRRCDDWMVPRQFWRTEGRRLSQVGFCSDPVFFALTEGSIKNLQQASAIARVLMFDDIGAAYVLRVLKIPQASKQSLAQGADDARFATIAAAVGALIANRVGAQPFAQRDAAYAAVEGLIAAWFVQKEAKRGWTHSSPELERFYNLQVRRRAGLACARAVEAGAPSGGTACDAETRAILMQARKELTRS